MEGKISDTTFVKDKNNIKKNEEDSQWKWRIYMCVYIQTYTHPTIYMGDI